MFTLADWHFMPLSRLFGSCATKLFFINRISISRVALNCSDFISLGGLGIPEATLSHLFQTSVEALDLLVFQDSCHLFVLLLFGILHPMALLKSTWMSFILWVLTAVGLMAFSTIMKTIFYSIFVNISKLTLLSNQRF